MNIRELESLPIVSLEISHETSYLYIENALLDSGSQSTLLPFDQLIANGIKPQPDAPMRRVMGIGDGEEWVMTMIIDELSIGDIKLNHAIIQAGNTGCGYGFSAIVGYDFLKAVGAVVDFGRMSLFLSEGKR